VVPTNELVRTSVLCSVLCFRRPDRHDDDWGRLAAETGQIMDAAFFARIGIWKWGRGALLCVLSLPVDRRRGHGSLSLSRSQNGHRSPLCQHKQNKARHNGVWVALSSTQPAVAFHLHPFQKERSAAAARNRQHTDAQRLREPPQQATRVSTQHITLTHLVAYVGPGPAPTVSILQTWREKEKQVRRGGSTEGGGYWEWMRRRLGRGPLVE
jgi:hypothetical protein